MTAEQNFQLLWMYSSQFLQKQEPFPRYGEKQQLFHQDKLSKYFLFEEKLLDSKTESFESLIKRCILEKKKMCNEDYKLMKYLCVDSIVHIAAYKPMDRLNQRLELYFLSNNTSIWTQSSLDEIVKKFKKAHEGNYKLTKYQHYVWTNFLNSLCVYRSYNDNQEMMNCLSHLKVFIIYFHAIWQHEPCYFSSKLIDESENITRISSYLKKFFNIFLSN